MKYFVMLGAVMALTACMVVQHGQQYRIIKSVPFLSLPEQSLHGDLYLPPGEGLKPAMLVVHGGGWSRRSGDMTGISERLAQAGFVVFNITYRLAPAYHYPTQVNDVTAALEWLYDHAEQYQVDPDQIGAWGYSAGAHLVLMAGLNRQQPPFLSSIVAGGTPAKLTAWPKSPLVTDLIGKTMAEAEAIWREASPVNQVVAESPPVFLYHGQWDKLVQPEQMAFMQQALAEQGVPVETYTVKLLGHIATYFLAGGAEDRGVSFALQHARSGTERQVADRRVTDSQVSAAP